MKRTILALNGWKGAGKDTVADYLVREHGFIRASFADALKQAVSEQFAIPLEYMHTPHLKELPLTQYPVIAGDPFSAQIHELLKSELKSGFWTPRALCILEGSIKRSVYSNYWVRHVISQIAQDITENYVISDMRYTTEADTLKLLLPDTVTVRVVREATVDTEDPSERNLDNYQFQYYLSNTGSQEKLYENVDSLLDAVYPVDTLKLWDYEGGE